MPDIVADNVTGLLVERGDVQGLTDALRKLSRDGAVRDRMGRDARRRAEEYFDWSVPAARLESLYQQPREAPVGTPVTVTHQAPVAAP